MAKSLAGWKILCLKYLLGCRLFGFRNFTGSVYSLTGTTVPFCTGLLKPKIKLHCHFATAELVPKISVIFSMRSVMLYSELLKASSSVSIPAGGSRTGYPKAHRCKHRRSVLTGY